MFVRVFSGVLRVRWAHTFSIFISIFIYRIPVAISFIVLHVNFYALLIVLDCVRSVGPPSSLYIASSLTLGRSTVRRASLALLAHLQSVLCSLAEIPSQCYARELEAQLTCCSLMIWFSSLEAHLLKNRIPGDRYEVTFRHPFGPMHLFTTNNSRFSTCITRCFIIRIYWRALMYAVKTRTNSRCGRK